MTTVKPGTRMTLAEYLAMPETDGGVWELINGEAYQMPPATLDHQFLMDFLVTMINNLMRAVQPMPGLAFSNVGLALSDFYAPTPDIVYLRAENLGLAGSGYVECILVVALRSQRPADDETCTLERVLDIPDLVVSEILSSLTATGTCP